MPRLIALVALCLLVVACNSGGGKREEPTSTGASTEAPVATAAGEPTPGVSIPHTEPATDIGLPDGFAAYPIATGFFRPTSIALADDGTVYVSERNGKVFRLADDDGDGVFDLVQWAEPQEEITGILAAPDGGLYVSTTGQIDLYQDTDGDGASDSSRVLITDLPHGRHQNNGLVLGPDGKLYLTNGSTCDDCVEEHERSGTILQANADGSDVRVYARGLRNPYDLVFDAQGRLWATDNGSDTPCATPDELDLIVDGGDYGWPYGADGCDAFNDGIAPAADLGLHTAATGIDTYSGTQFPSEYDGNLFATVWGSFFAEPAYEPSLLRLVVQPGEPATAQLEQFGTGFQHPIDVMVDGDGSLLVLDYGEGEDSATSDSGTLYRIVYTGG